MENKREMTVPALGREVAQMEADIKTTIAVFSSMMGVLGIQAEHFQKGTDIGSVIPVILKNLTTKMMMGQLDASAFAQITAITPIFERYKHLVDETLKSVDNG